MMRESNLIPAILAVLFAMAYGVSIGPFVGETLSIDRGTVVRQQCHYLSWRGVHTITIEPDSELGCPWFVAK